LKILFLTQYFPPEVGAPQNRLFELAIRLKKKGADILVLTAMPNYPQMKVHEEYKGKCRYYEEMNGLKVYRSWIFVSQRRSIFFRLLNYFSFVWSSFWAGWFRLRKFDYIFCESPPLFLGISAYLLKKLKGAKLIFNVSDLWPESAEKLGLVTNKTFLNISTKLEEFLYKKSEVITGQTQGIVSNISSRFPGKKVYWLPNGVDVDYYNPDFIKTDWRKENKFHDDDFILIYAGIIGHAQGLEVILHAANLLRNERDIKFIILGSGPEREKLINLKTEMNLDNVLFLETILKKDMSSIIKAVDVSIIPLRKIDLFKGAIPSKIFESLAMKKPALLGVEGEAKELFIDQGKCGLFFEPENAEDLSEKILELYSNNELRKELGENGRDFVMKKFNRDILAENFWNYLSGQK
jgi:glycosyltransferase involved in cell wall biosynthesis